MTFAKIMYHCFLRADQFSDKSPMKTCSRLHPSLTCHIQAQLFRGRCSSSASVSHEVTVWPALLQILSFTSLQSFDCVSTPASSVPVNASLHHVLSICTFASSLLALLHSDLRQNSRNQLSCITIATFCQHILLIQSKVTLNLPHCNSALLSFVQFKKCGGNGFPLQISDVFVVQAHTWKRNKTKAVTDAQYLNYLPSS